MSIVPVNSKASAVRKSVHIPIHFPSPPCASLIAVLKSSCIHLHVNDKFDDTIQNRLLALNPITVYLMALLD